MYRLSRESVYSIQVFDGWGFGGLRWRVGHADRGVGAKCAGLIGGFATLKMKQLRVQ